MTASLHKDGPLQSEVTLFYWENLGASERNTIKIARFMGRQIRPLQLTREALQNEQFFNGLLSAGACVITSAQTLSEIRGCKQRGVELLGLIRSLAANVFVYGFEPSRPHGLILQELTSGSLLGVESLPLGDYKFTVDQHSRNICRQFTGLSFGIADSDTDFVFVEGTKQSHTSLIRLGQRPFFVSSKDGGCHWFLLACDEVADLDGIIPWKASVLQFFPGLVPLMMFIASVSGNDCWQNDTPTACFMVDDPLLKRRYGFLDYRKLLEVMERERFCTSMAFIPWNYRRSDPRVAELFATHPHRYSLCVHGCDHTGREFGVTNPLWLRQKAQEAFDRMTMHRKLSGLPFDDVMVFPQGIFSTAAMKALKSCGYLAAVNSTPFPVDAGDSLILRDLLEVAVTQFSNFPLFIRRSPENLAELAFDLFLGKPALVVEHHGYFRDGYNALAGVIQQMNALDERLHWTSLATICARACLKRGVRNGDIHVQFFTDRFRLRNDAERPQHYVLSRRTLSTDQPTMVTIDGRNMDYCMEEDCLRTELTLGAGTEMDVRVQHGYHEPMSGPARQDPMHTAKVFIRRSLSEFRDNYLDKNRFLGNSARNLIARKSRRLPKCT